MDLFSASDYNSGQSKNKKPASNESSWLKYTFTNPANNFSLKYQPLPHPISPEKPWQTTLFYYFGADTLYVYSRLLTADSANDLSKVFRITHPFHPWFGQKFEMLAVRKNWGEDRVFFVGYNERMQSIPTTWTDIGPEDPFVVLANGRCQFKPADLLALRRLIDDLEKNGFQSVK